MISKQKHFPLHKTRNYDIQHSFLEEIFLVKVKHFLSSKFQLQFDRFLSSNLLSLIAHQFVQLTKQLLEKLVKIKGKSKTQVCSLSSSKKCCQSKK